MTRAAIIHAETRYRVEVIGIRSRAEAIAVQEAVRAVPASIAYTPDPPELNMTPAEISAEVHAQTGCMGDTGEFKGWDAIVAKDEVPELPPAVEAYAEAVEQPDPPDVLKNGEAYREHGE